MKIFIYMKSRFAYDRLKQELEDKHEIYQHVENFEDIQELLVFWNPDVAVLDQKSNYYLEIKELFYRFGIDVVEFQSDFQSVIEDIDNYAIFHKDKNINQQEKYIPDLNEYYKKTKEPVRNEAKEKVKIEIRKEIIEKEVERLKYTTIPPKLIVIGSLWPGAGSTLFSMNLAKAISNRNVHVSYVEYPGVKPYVFDYLNIAEKEKEYKFNYSDLTRELNEKGFIAPGRGWVYEGIQWILNDSRYSNVDNWTYEKMIKLIYSLRNTPITIVDISTMWLEQDVREFLHHADHIYVIVEPDPVKIDWLTTVYGDNKKDIQRKENKIIEHLKEIYKKEKIPYEFITLKMNENVDKDVWEECFNQKPISYLENIPYEDAIKATWDSKFLYDDSKYQAKFEKAFKPIIDVVLPNNFKHVNSKEEELNKIDKVFNIFKRRNER